MTIKREPVCWLKVFKFPDVTARALEDGRLTTTVYLERGRWRSGKKLGSWRLRLNEMALADGVPRSCTGHLIAPTSPPHDERKDQQVGQHSIKMVDNRIKNIRIEARVTKDRSSCPCPTGRTVPTDGGGRGRIGPATRFTPTSTILFRWPISDQNPDTTGPRTATDQKRGKYKNALTR